MKMFIQSLINQKTLGKIKKTLMKTVFILPPRSPLYSIYATPSTLFHLNSCPNTETSNCLASLLYYQSIPASVGHIKPYALILTDATDLKQRFISGLG